MYLDFLYFTFCLSLIHIVTENSSTNIFRIQVAQTVIIMFKRTPPGGACLSNHLSPSCMHDDFFLITANKLGCIGYLLPSGHCSDLYYQGNAVVKNIAEPIDTSNLCQY